jgi:hypothetical protein
LIESQEPSNTSVHLQSTSRPWLDSVDVDKAGHSPLFEPFVDENAVARFLQITPRRILEMARQGEIPAHPIGHERKTWRFRMSEIDAHFSTPAAKNSGATMSAAVPGTQGRKKTWVKGQ